MIFLTALWCTVWRMRLPETQCRSLPLLAEWLWRFVYHQTLRKHNNDINPQDIRKYDCNIFRNLSQLTLFQCHFIWNSAWTFNNEINSITQGLREAFVIFNAANTNRSVRSTIRTFHFPHTNLKSKPRTRSGMDCARWIAGCAGSCCQCATGGGEVIPRNDEAWSSACTAARIIIPGVEMEGSGQLQAPAALPRYPFTTRLSGCQKWSRRGGDENITCRCWNLNTGSPAHSQSLELTANMVNYDILPKKTDD